MIKYVSICAQEIRFDFTRFRFNRTIPFLYPAEAAATLLYTFISIRDLKYLHVQNAILKSIRFIKFK